MTQKAFQDYYPDQFSHCYGCGRLNEHGLHIKSYWDGDESVCIFQPKPYHTAIPGYVYGGLIASLIDCHKAMGLSLEARLQLRQREAKPIFMDVGPLIATLRKDVLPKSPLGQALSYAENQWPAMARYLEVAQAELDNNSTEHALRGVVLVRRNWLHVGQEAGGEKAANLFSLMITCKRLGVDPMPTFTTSYGGCPAIPTRTSGS